MQAVIGNDSLDAALANWELSLAQLLSDHRRGGIGIQKAVAQDLPNDLLGAAVIGFGTGLVGRQSEQPTGFVVLQELVITLAAETILLGDVDDVVFQTLAFQEHEEAMSQMIGGIHGQVADGADQLVSFLIELQGRIHEKKIGGGQRSV